MQSLEYAKRQKAFKKVTQMLTNVLRLHPTKAELWIYAASFAMEEHADMTEARSYMQRGLRFCKRSKPLWLEFCKLEMTYIAKIHARRLIMGLGDDHEGRDDQALEEDKIAETSAPIARDIVAAIDGDNDQDAETLNEQAKLTTVSRGAVPLAIFEAAMIQFDDDADMALGFFNVFAQFPEAPPTPTLLQQVESRLENKAELCWQTRACQIQRPLIGIPTSSPDFPAAFRDSLNKLRSAKLLRSGQLQLNASVERLLETLLVDDDLDPAIRRVIESTLGTFLDLRPQERV